MQISSTTRSGEAERRRVVFGGMIRIKTAAVVGFGDLQPLLVEFVQGQVVAVEVIEDSEFHSPLLSFFPYVPRSSSARGRVATRSGGLWVLMEGVA
jgi:hypothetical protein